MKKQPSHLATRTVSIPVETVERRIYLIRAQKVMLDTDLAEMYGVKTKAFNQAVMRNSGRFPMDFMFRLSREEATMMRSQFVTASRRNIRFLPYAFTEQGVAMLSSVLKSERAVQVNIVIMRAFVKLREALASHKDLSRKLTSLESKYQKHDSQIKEVFDAIRALIETPKPGTRRKRRIGYLAKASIRS